MALYNDIVMDNFLNPKNVGELENPDGAGVYGALLRRHDADSDKSR